MRGMRTPPGAALVTGATSGIGEAFARALPPSSALLLTGESMQTGGGLTRSE